MDGNNEIKAFDEASRAMFDKVLTLSDEEKDTYLTEVMAVIDELELYAAKIGLEL